jgi:uncharacterized membrane protein
MAKAKSKSLNRFIIILLLTLGVVFVWLSTQFSLHRKQRWSSIAAPEMAD